MTLAHIRASLIAIAERPSSKKNAGPCNGQTRNKIRTIFFLFYPSINQRYFSRRHLRGRERAVRSSLTILLNTSILMRISKCVFVSNACLNRE